MAGVEAVEETAKAVQEVSKVAGKAIDASTKAGAFFTRVFGGPIQDVADIVKVHTELWKIQNALAVQEKVDALLSSREAKTIRAVEFRIGIPLLESAVREDDPDLQTMWAGLLAAAMDERTASSVKRSHIEVAKQLEPHDAKYLNAIHSMNVERAVKKANVFTKSCLGEEAIKDWQSIRNLERLGLIYLKGQQSEDTFRLIMTATDWAANNQLDFCVGMSSFGYTFARAATNKGLIFPSRNEEWFPVDFDEFVKTVPAKSTQPTPGGSSVSPV